MRKHAAASIATTLLALIISSASPQPAVANEIDPPASDVAGAIERWTEFRAAEDGSEVEAATFSGFRSATLELGALELRDHAAVLFAEATAAEQGGDDARANTLRTWAETLDPSATARLRERTYQVTRQAPWRGDRVLASVIASGQLTAQTAEGRALLLSATSALGAFAALLAVFAFAVAVFARTVVLSAADLHRPLRHFATVWQARMVVATLVALPALFFWSPALAVVSAITVAAVHMGWRDRLVGIALLAVVTLVPAALETSLVAGRAARTASEVQPAVSGICDAACLEQLEFAAGRGDSDARLALAWWSWRVGMPESRARAAEIVETVETNAARAASIATLRGNLALAAGQNAAAAELFTESRDAAVSDDQRAVASFNLHRVHMLAQDSALARTALREATAANAVLVNTAVEYDGQAQNRLVLSCPFPASIDMVRPGPFPAELSPSVNRTLAQLGRWPLAFGGLPGVAMGLAVLLVLGWPLGRIGRVARPCKRCGTATSARIHAVSAAAGVCEPCHQLATDQRLSYTQRGARERRVETVHVLRLGSALLVGAALPGLPTIARGATLRGALFVVVGAAGIVLWTGIAGDWMTVLAPLGEGDPALSRLFGIWLHGTAAFATVVDAAIHYRRRR